ncbi:MAG: PilT/PilU family type 4a pilus ATPase [Planctomycetota bacterium]|jgi:twitching motility protein PilT
MERDEPAAAEAEAPGAPPSKQAVEDFMRGPAGERREADRLQKVFFATVHGRHGAYRAMVLNISRRGALVTVVDPSFEISQQQSDVGLAGLRIASHFGGGLRLELLDVPVSAAADVVRLTEGRKDDEYVFWLGCRFQRELSGEECELLGLPVSEVVPPEAQAATLVGAQLQGGGHPGQVVVVQGGSLDAAKLRRRDDRRPARVRIAAKGPTLNVHDLLELAVERRASDLHVKAGSPVRLRVHGEILEAGDRRLGAEDARALVQELLTPEQFDHFEETGDLDLAYALEGKARFRVNVLRSRREMGLAIRRIPEEVPTAAQLGLAPACMRLAEKPRGLVLVTGPTGSGKSTTLASMIQHVDRTRACHIITMEDPIEFIHTEHKAHITQREIGYDTGDFASALKRAMRQDPDVILVGEMRDLETMALAVTAAETGHLVFATLHTHSAVLTVDRIVDVFPPAQQRQIRMQLADALLGIICQTLLPRVGGGVVVAQEILVASPGVRALIREGKAPQMANMMQTGAKAGMQTLEDSLNDLIARRLIRYEAALAKANHPNLIEKAGKQLQREG